MVILNPIWMALPSRLGTLDSPRLASDGGERERERELHVCVLAKLEMSCYRANVCTPLRCMDLVADCCTVKRLW